MNPPTTIAELIAYLQFLGTSADMPIGIKAACCMNVHDVSDVYVDDGTVVFVSH